MGMLKGWGWMLGVGLLDMLNIGGGGGVTREHKTSQCIFQILHLTLNSREQNICRSRHQRTSQTKDVLSSKISFYFPPQTVITSHSSTTWYPKNTRSPYLIRTLAIDPSTPGTVCRGLMTSSVSSFLASAIAATEPWSKQRP